MNLSQNMVMYMAINYNFFEQGILSDIIISVIAIICLLLFIYKQD